MKKQLFSLILAVCLVFCLVLPAGAQGASVVDQAGLLTVDEISDLEWLCGEFYTDYSMDLVFVTADSLGGVSAQTYADDFYDNGGYSADGILFLLAMEEREWYISTAGRAIIALSDDSLTQLEDEVLPYLSEGEYFDAFSQFYYSLPWYLDTRTPVETYYGSDGRLYADYGTEAEGEVSFLLSVLIGAVVAGIVVLIMRASMNTRRAQHSAAGYRTTGSFQLLRQTDQFLYSNVTKVKKPEPQPTNTTSGGSSVHRSSGGASHGGRGGKF